MKNKHVISDDKIKHVFARVNGKYGLRKIDSDCVMAASKGCRKRLSQISILSILHAVFPREIKDNAYATFLGGGGRGCKQNISLEW